MNVNQPHGKDGSTIQATQTQDMQSVERSLAGSETTTSSTPSSNEGLPSPRSNHASPQPAHQRFVFTDPVAFRYVTANIALCFCFNDVVKVP